MFIYLIVNHVTGKYYVGQHKGADLRKYLQRKFSDARHGRGGSSRLYRSMRKHPLPCDWSIHALLPDVQTHTELDAYEKDFIAFLRSQDPEYGYNICRGGEGFTGPHTAKAKAKMSVAAKITCNYLKAAEANRGKPRPPQVGEAVRRMRTGSKATTETKEKIRAARLAQSDPRLGTHHSEATKKRMSDAKKGTPSTFRGKRHTDKSNEKNRQAHLLNLQGQQFGNVLVVSLAGTPQGHAEWMVRCVVCGTEGTAKRSGRVRSGDSAFIRAHLHPAT